LLRLIEDLIEDWRRLDARIISTRSENDALAGEDKRCRLMTATGHWTDCIERHRAPSSSRVRSAAYSASSNASSDAARYRAVIGHMKTDGHLGRCYLTGRDGDAANVILSGVGPRIILASLRRIPPFFFFVALFSSFTISGLLKSPS
jgi:hypothetical protein